MRNLRDAIHCGGPWVLSLWCALVCAACDAPVQVEILTYVPENDRYEFQVVTLETIEDIHTLSGEATYLVGGTDMVLDYGEGLVVWNRPGRPVAFGAAKRRGVYYPEDFHSMAMAAVYYNVERAALFATELGMDYRARDRLPTYYWARIKERDRVGTGVSEDAVDNAFYLAIDEDDRGFYVLPFATTEGVPFSMNLGIMAHEYAHSLFQELVYDRLDAGQVAFQNAHPDAANYLAATNEGLADVFAVALTGDPDYMRHSQDDLYSTRDARDYIGYWAFFDTLAQTVDPSQYDPYEIGAFLSSALYAIERRIDRMDGVRSGPVRYETRVTVAKAAFAALAALDPEQFIGYTVTDFLNAFVLVLPEDSRPAACTVLSNRYEVHFQEVYPCADGVAP